MSDRMTDERLVELVEIVNGDIHAFTLRECVKEIQHLRNDVSKLGGVVDLALDCWGRQKSTEPFHIRWHRFHEALCEIDKES